MSPNLAQAPVRGNKFEPITGRAEPPAIGELDRLGSQADAVINVCAVTHPIVENRPPDSPAVGRDDVRRAGADLSHVSSIYLDIDNLAERHVRTPARTDVKIGFAALDAVAVSYRPVQHAAEEIGQVVGVTLTAGHDVYSCGLGPLVRHVPIGHSEEEEKVEADEDS